MAFFIKLPSIFTISRLTEGSLLYTADMPKIPVLASAAIERTAKYTELKGFLLNHLYFTLVAASSIVNRSSCKPAKNAEGTFANKNMLKANGDANRFLKLLKFGFKLFV
ncbi:MAG: hypothetical protein JWQ40_3773 [Segetibacter sp.]|nr:hypothetical protein [Segetibacter sp.]